MESNFRAAHRDGPAPAWRGVVLPFVASRCAALIYEVVWYHLLRFGLLKDSE